MKRRVFLQNTVQTAIAGSLAPAFLIKGTPKKKQRLTIIGCGWWGNNILREAVASDRVKVVGICDVDQRALDQTAKNVSEWSSDKPKQFKDYQDCLRKTRPDLVIVATPDHWHALPAIAAMEQGAHVFLEKPIGHTIKEGSAMLRTARATKRMVQVDTHRRVSPHNISGIEFLKSGKVGKISSVKCFVVYGGGPGEVPAKTEVPKELDWDAYVGPAPAQAYNPQIHPKGFRNFLDFANGTMGDWGIHWFDQVLWWTEERAPKTIFSTGSRYHKADSTDAPDTQHATFQFEEFDLTWEHRLNTPNTAENHNLGAYFHGTEGTFHLGWLDGWTFYPRKKGASPIHQKPTLHDPDKQNIKELWADFMSSIDDNRLPVCDIEKGHLATNISLLGMISYKLGRNGQWDHEKERFINDPQADALLARNYRSGYEFPG